MDRYTYDDWVRIGLAIKGSLGEDGWTLFAACSARSRKDDPAFTPHTWRGLQPRGIGFGSLQHYASRSGWAPSPELIFNAAETAAEPVVDISGITAKARARPPSRPGGRGHGRPGTGLSTDTRN